MWGVSAWLSGAGGQGFAFYPLLFSLEPRNRFCVSSQCESVRIREAMVVFFGLLFITTPHTDFEIEM
jgi:hypothetical protein